MFREKNREKDLGEFSLHVPGAHNVLNATAAVAVGTALDLPADQIRAGLDGFRGVDRRFQLKGQSRGGERG
jgi:UDP-N-acetylmuramate--alanine ligase